MKSGLGAATLICLTLTACGGSDRQVVDGALVGADGWPIRPADEQLRCPDGSFIVDEMVGERRRVTCRTRLNPRPRGFELAWHANGQLATRRTFDEVGRPVAIVNFDESGRKVAEEEWVDGVRMRSEAWYPNGQQRSEERFVPKNGGANITTWAPDGSVESKGMIVDGARQGPWTEWVDGALEDADYVAGVRSGGVRRTYPDRSVETGQYIDGLRDGRWTRKDSSGLPLKEQRYDRGVLQGKWRAWHPNQQPKAEGTYLDGNKHGQWTYWHPSGEVAAREFYRCGVPHGLLRRFHPNGQAQTLGVFWDGQKIGEWQTWNPAGDLTKVDRFSVPEEVDDLEGLRAGSTIPPLPEACPKIAPDGD